MSKIWRPKSVKSSKSVKKYYCEYCDYSASQKCHYDKHLSSKKHQKMSLQNGVQSLQKGSKMETLGFFCKFCDRKYKTKGGMYKHIKKCKFRDMVSSKSVKKCKKSSAKSVNVMDAKDLEIENLKNENLKLKVEIKDEKIKSLEKQIEYERKIAKTCMEVAKTNATTNNFNNCGNQNISIKLFLNENCKDALNLTDFVKNIQVTLEDLAYTKNNGFVDGVTNIIKKQLEDLKPTERPIHCSDAKRLKFYVKDNDKWEKDENNEKIDNTIRDVKLKQTKTMTEWEKQNPTYKNDSKLMDEWMDILDNVSEGPDNPKKAKTALKKKIASCTEIKDAMEKIN